MFHVSSVVFISNSKLFEWSPHCFSDELLMNQFFSPSTHLLLLSVSHLLYMDTYMYIFICPALSRQPNRLGKLAEQVLWDKSGSLLCCWACVCICVCFFVLHDVWSCFASVHTHTHSPLFCFSDKSRLCFYFSWFFIGFYPFFMRIYWEQYNIILYCELAGSTLQTGRSQNVKLKRIFKYLLCFSSCTKMLLLGFM